MRKWGEMHPALRAVLVGVVAFAAILAAGLILGGDLDDAVANAVFYALLIGGGVFFLTTFPTGTVKLDEPGKFVIFLRFPGSSPGSLNSTWQVGIASPGPGQIDFQPTIHDELIPSGRSKALTGLRVMDSPPRKANRHDGKQEVPLDFQIISLTSDRGVIEIAASPAALRNLQRVVSTPM